MGTTCQPNSTRQKALAQTAASSTDRIEYFKSNTSVSDFPATRQSCSPTRCLTSRLATQYAFQLSFMASWFVCSSPRSSVVPATRRIEHRGRFCDADDAEAAHPKA